MISGLFTLGAIACFAGVCAWAGARRNAARFAAAARLPLADDLPAHESPTCCRESSS